MISSLEDLKAAIGGDDDKPVTNQQRRDWGNYVDWLDKRGMKGHPDLDKNNLGKSMLSKYIKENPSTSLTSDSVIPIQKEFSNYRNWSIDQVKKGKMAFGEGVDEHNYMKELSVVDGIPGQYTTRHKFPEEYMETFEDKKLMSTEDKGFATAKN